MKEDLKEVCAYVRVSTDKQEELSPDSQIRLIKDYAQSHRMLLSRIFIEERGISGKSDKRPAFQEMIAMCKDKSHPYDAILLWKYSRFARNMDEASYYKSILRKKCNVDVISISEPIVDDIYGRLIESVIEWSDEFYLVNLSGEVMRGMTQNALRGGYNANAPFGYVKQKGRENIPTVVPAQAAVVRKIFDMYVNKKMPRCDIASTLNSLHISTNRGGYWDTRSITYVLENPFYIGKIRWNFFDRAKNQRKAASDVIVSDGKHEPIIDKETFAEAGRLLAKDRSSSCYGQKRSLVAQKHWLSGIVKCSQCGGSLGYNNGSKKNHTAAYFSCWKHGKGLCPQNGYISCSRLERMAIDSITALSENFDCFFNTFDLPEDDSVVYLKKELSQLSKKERRIKDAYISGIDTLEEYKDNKELIRERQEELLLQLKEAEKVTPIRESQQFIDFTGLIDMLNSPDVEYVAKGNAIRNIFDHFTYDKENDRFDCFLNENITKNAR